MEIDKIKKICVGGAGTMGHQIALQCAVHNYEVNLVDISKEALVKAQEKIRKVLEERVGLGEISSDSMQKALSRISYATDLEKAARDADFVIEAVSEDVKVKRQVFSQLDRVCPSHTILATNSSSIKCSLLADATKRPEKVVNMHFLNPVWVRPLVEVMGSAGTSEGSIKTTVELGKHISLTPVVVNGEVTGYIFMGMDAVGLDVILAVEEQWYKESGDESDKPPKILVEKVKKGELGVKTGKGFYEYPNPSFEKPG